MRSVPSAVREHYLSTNSVYAKFTECEHKISFVLLPCGNHTFYKNITLIELAYSCATYCHDHFSTLTQAQVALLSLQPHTIRAPAMLFL